MVWDYSLSNSKLKAFDSPESVTLYAVDLVNAWAYAKAYPEEIETAIREEKEVMESAIWSMASIYADEQFPLSETWT